MKPSFSIAKSSPVFFNEVYLGEGIETNYNGPQRPSFKLLESNRRIIDLNEDYLENFSIHTIDSQNQIQSLEKFLTVELQQSLQCSDELLGENLDYIRYLFRLITLNYVFEILEKIHLEAYRYGFEKSICNIDWKSQINKCSAKSTDMRIYLNRVRSQLSKSKLSYKYSFSSKTELKKLYENLSKTQDPIVKTVIETNCSNCRDISKNNLKKYFINSCDELKSTFMSICSEQDLLYGLSPANMIRDVLLQTNVLSNVDNNQTNCLFRFVDLFKSKESYEKNLISFVDAIYSDLKNRTSASARAGRFFVQGALKEFDEKGLKDFLFKPEKVSIKATVAKATTPLPKVLPTVIEDMKDSKSVKTNVKVEKKKKKRIKISEFEKAMNKMRKDAKDALIGLEAFKSEKRFTQENLEFLREATKNLITRNSLVNMKRFDSLGTRKVPMKLSIIKYLVDEDNHQGLFNIMFVLGNQFYIYNDLEGKNDVVLFGLTNNKQTEWKWEMKLISE